MRLRLAGGALGLAVVLAGVGCGPSGPSGGPSAPLVSSGAPSSPSAPASTSASASGISISPGSSTPSLGPLSSAEPNAGLFAAVGGDSSDLEFRYDPDTTASVAADPGIAKDAALIAIGLYTIRGQQPVADYAIVSILQLRDPKADDEWYRSYRDSYDTSACAQAGGVARHAQTTLGGNTVFVGACAGGAFTYHVRWRDQTVVSITAVGPARLGDRLAADVGKP